MSERVTLKLANGQTQVIDGVVDVDVGAAPAPTVSLTAKPADLPYPGGAVVLAWVVSDTASVTVKNQKGDTAVYWTGAGQGGETGSATVTISAPDVLTAFASGPGGDAQSEPVTIVVEPAAPTLPTLDGVSVPNPVEIDTWGSGDHVLIGDGTTHVDVNIPGFYPEYMDALAKPPTGPNLDANGYLVFANSHSGGWRLLTKGVASLSVGGNPAPMTPIGTASAGPSGTGGQTPPQTRNISYPTSPSRSVTPPTSTAALAVRIQDPATQEWFLLDSDSGKKLDDCQNYVTGRTVKNIFAFDLTTTLGAWFATDGVRNEIAISLGADSMDIANHGPNQLSYHIDILKAGNVVASYNIGTDTFVHSRRQEWVWEDQPQEISLAAIQTAISSGFLLPYDVNATSQAAPNPPAPYVPLGFSNMAGYEPTTGGRPELAFIEGWLAYLLAQIRAGNTNVDLSWITTIADCCASENLHYTDFEAMGPVDPRKYPINFYTNGPTNLSDGSSVLLSGSSPQVVMGAQNSSVTAQAAHSPDLLLLALIATGNPRYVRYSQERIIYAVCSTPPGASTLTMRDEPRGNYWGLRDAHMSAWARRQVSASPSWLLDAPTGPGIGDLIRDNTISWMKPFADQPVTTPAGLFAAFTTTQNDDPAPTQQNVPNWENNGYGCPVYAWLTLQNVTNAKEILTWLARSAVAQAKARIYHAYWPVFTYVGYDSTRAYVSGGRCTYNGKVYASLVDANAGTTPGSDPTKWQVVQGATPVCTTWLQTADCSNTQLWTGDAVTVSPEGEVVPAGTDYDYPVKVLDAMSVAVIAGLTDTDIPGLSTELAYLKGIMPKGNVCWEQAFAS